MDNAAEATHMARIHASVHTPAGYKPFSLHACPKCHRLYQLAPVSFPAMRKHLINGTVNRCEGSLQPPLQGCRAMVHRTAPGALLLQCCGRPPSQVPVFDQFSTTAAGITCPGRNTGTAPAAGEDQA